MALSISCLFFFNYQSLYNSYLFKKGHRNGSKNYFENKLQYFDFPGVPFPDYILFQPCLSSVYWLF